MANQQPQQNRIEFVAATEKKTANTVRFEELVPPGAQPVVGYLYIRKKALALIGNPAIVTITITGKESSG